MDTRRIFEEMERTIEKSEMIVLRDLNTFPVYGQDIISPYLMVCINHSGTARALYDMQEVVFHPNEIAVVLPNHILHPIESSSDYRVTILVHSIPFCEDLKTKRLSHDRYKFHRLPASKVTEDEMNEFMQAVDVLEHICLSSEQRYPLRHEMLIAQTNVMTEMLNAYRREIDRNAIHESHNYGIFLDFCDELTKYYTTEHEVAFYADKAHMSTRHFSVIIKSIVGISASDYIEEYLITQAKNILQSRPDLSVQQISDHLGYADSPSFCRFFKRKINTTPKEYRER